jgi:hypothetical protein
VQTVLLRCQSREDQMESHYRRTHHHVVPHSKIHGALEAPRSREGHRIRNRRDHHLVA